MVTFKEDKISQIQDIFNKIDGNYSMSDDKFTIQYDIALRGTSTVAFYIVKYKSDNGRNDIIVFQIEGTIRIPYHIEGIHEFYTEFISRLDAKNAKLNSDPEVMSLYSDFSKQVKHQVRLILLSHFN